MNSFRQAVLIAVIGVAAVGTASAQVGPGPFAYFPTADVTDARMLSFGCVGIDTFEQVLSLTIAVPPGETQFTLSIFDGDTGMADGAGARHWDLGTRQLLYALYTDPFASGSTADLVGMWQGNAVNPTSGPGWMADAASMPDNDWWNLTVTPSAAALSPSGNYFYHLQITEDGLCTPTENLASDLKIAASSPMTFVTSRFGFEASLRNNFADGKIVYPAWDGATLPGAGSTFWLDTPTTYDGTFEFFLNVPFAQTELTIFDGDFDRGNAILTGIPSGLPLDPCGDTDDPNTDSMYAGFPADFFPPGFDIGAAIAGGSLKAEGANTPGIPPDDNRFDFFRRGEIGDANARGCVRYEVTDPSGTVYRNDDPSGNLEWEEFRLASLLDPNQASADIVVPSNTLPTGVWKVEIKGLDLSNLNFWRMDTVCAIRDGEPACPPPVFVVGDTVWLDTNGNGVQDVGEPGIPGVVVNLIGDPAMPPLATRLTGDTSAPEWAECVNNNTGLDTMGLYCFGVNQPGSYTVEIAPENFLPGGALFGLTSTTGGESQNDSVVDDNVLTYDFGYRNLGAIGDRVWLDLDGDGVQDAGEAGINGVTVSLLDGAGNVIATQTTSGDGNYLFANLPPGTYSVVVDAGTLPAGLVQTYDLDGLATPNRATIDLGAGESRLDLDFGYVGCGPCLGKVSSLTLQYLGSSGGQIQVVGRRGPSDDELFYGVVLPGGTFDLVGPDTGKGGFKGTLGTEISLFVDGVLNTTIHTSCSQPIGPGQISGDFLILAGASKEGGALCSYDGGGPPPPPPPSAPGTGTIGYWKNHPEAWPQDTIVVGGVTWSKTDAIALMDTPSRGDKTIDLFKQLVAAKLNVLIGNDASCIADTIAAADAWLLAHPVGSGVKSNSTAWKNQGGALHDALDDYNNGRLCAPHRD